MALSAEETVLLVDDDAAVRDSIKVLLELHGFNVVEFHAADALLADYAILPHSCLVADVEMPMIGGVELLARLAEDGKRLPAVLITGRIDERVRLLAVKAGAFALIEKPFDSAALVDAVRRALNADAPARKGEPAGGPDGLHAPPPKA